ncbi:MAG TPA: gliding motility-associated C-terminal domain-containing protein [Chryseolinea sp.]|jgi:CHU_C Type IX secretion signal domain|nr:gliding motility-associated C-terminal domain-containing protein [Chryseolinea sp.]
MKTFLLLLTLQFILLIQSLALSVTINQTGTAANSCSRSLTAVVSGGSGSYSYTWSIVTPAIAWPTTNGVASVSLALSQTADVNVSVQDLNTNQMASATVTVYRVLMGGFDTFIPNLITPNGDGYNDNWIVTASGTNYSPINAYSYTLTIKNASNVQVFAASATVTANHLGVIGGDIIWNARLNGSGSIVPTGVYTYQLTLVNCSQSTVYNGQLNVLY